MNDDEKREKIIEIVFAINTLLWHYNNYGNSTSFCETEFNGIKIKMKKFENPDATCYVIISIDGVEFLDYDKGVKMFNQIVSQYQDTKELQRLSDLLKILK